jgi:hypothetical protein
MIPLQKPYKIIGKLAKKAGKTRANIEVYR